MYQWVAREVRQVPGSGSAGRMQCKIFHLCRQIAAVYHNVACRQIGGVIGSQK